MNREILFRGKRVSDGKWVEGFYNRCEARLSSTEDHFKNNPRSWIQTVDVEGFAEKLTQVDPSTVGQFTGLKDRNGQRIFEGDVVEHNGKRFAIEFIRQCARFAPVRPNTVFAVFNLSTVDVIGNIHDNPDLMREP